MNEPIGFSGFFLWRLFVSRFFNQLTYPDPPHCPTERISVLQLPKGRKLSAIRFMNVVHHTLNQSAQEGCGVLVCPINLSKHIRLKAHGLAPWLIRFFQQESTGFHMVIVLPAAHKAQSLCFLPGQPPITLDCENPTHSSIVLNHLEKPLNDKYLFCFTHFLRDPFQVLAIKMQNPKVVLAFSACYSEIDEMMCISRSLQFAIHVIMITPERIILTGPSTFIINHMKPSIMHASDEPELFILPVFPSLFEEAISHHSLEQWKSILSSQVKSLSLPKT